jgi:hypothetical protein
LPIPEAPTSPPLSTPSGLPWQETPTQPQAQQGALTLPENSLAAAIPFPRHAEEEQEISPWESPPSFIDEPPPHPEGPIPAPDQPSYSEAPEQTPTQSTAVSSPLPFENEAGKKGRKRKTKKLKSSQGQKSTSPRRLPIILKITIPLLLLAGIGVGYVKFWPETQAKLGMGPPLKTSSPETPPGMPTSLKTEDDPSGFKYIDEANSKTEAVTPSPEARFEADPIPEAEPLELEAVSPPAKSPPFAQVIPEDEDAGVTAARKILDKVLAAKNSDDLMPLILGAVRLRPQMDAYYASNPAPLETTFIAHESSGQLPDSQHDHHTFLLSTTKQAIRFPVGIEETDDGPKLDWETFIELHDDMLGDFLKSPTSEAKTFHVILRRAHYFGSDIPALGAKNCFRISTPIAGTEAYAFVEKDTQIAEDCAFFKWDLVCFPIATLEWKTPESGKPYLSIRRIVQKSWRAKKDAN